MLVASLGVMLLCVFLESTKVNGWLTDVASLSSLVCLFPSLGRSQELKNIFSLLPHLIASANELTAVSVRPSQTHFFFGKTTCQLLHLFPPLLQLLAALEYVSDALNNTQHIFKFTDAYFRCVIEHLITLLLVGSTREERVISVWEEEFESFIFSSTAAAADQTNIDFSHVLFSLSLRLQCIPTTRCMCPATDTKMWEV